MPHRHQHISQVQDTVLAGGLVSAPAWASWLGEVNEILTTLSLAIGLVLGAARLWFFLSERLRKSRAAN